MLFPYAIQVNNSLMPTRVLTSLRIKTVVFWMILIFDVMFGLIYSAAVRFEPKTSRSESRRSTNWAYQVSMHNTCRENSFWIEILSFVAVEIGKRTKQENQNKTGKKWTDCLSTFPVRRITENHTFTEKHRKPPKTTWKIIFIGELYPPSICFLVVYVYN